MCPDATPWLAALDPMRRMGKYELRYSDRGEPFYAWTWNVPRVDDLLLDCVAYIYRSVEQARESKEVGGSGFLIGVPSQRHPEHVHIYVATASHVIAKAVQRGKPVVRVNSSLGTALRIFETEATDWRDHPGDYDVAIAYVGPLLPPGAAYQAIRADTFLTDDIAEAHDIGPGDDCCMISRFLYHAGRERNRPIVRFGNLSAMPSEPIYDERNVPQLAYLVEMRSIGGHSGSPVFVTAYTGTDKRFLKRLLGRAKPAEAPVGGLGPWLLGIDVGHVPITMKVKMPKPDGSVREEWVPIENSGQAIVVPAQRLTELLNDARFVALRDAEDARIEQHKENPRVVLDSGEESPTPGPEPERLAIEGDWDDAARRALRAGKPPKRGKPRRKRKH